MPSPGPEEQLFCQARSPGSQRAAEWPLYTNSYLDLHFIFHSQFNLFIPSGEKTSLAPPIPGKLKVRNIVGSFLGGFGVGKVLTD